MIECEECIAQAREEELCQCEAKADIPYAKSYMETALPRINELLIAIGKAVNMKGVDRTVMSKVKLWTKELESQVDLIDTMLIYDT